MNDSSVTDFFKFLLGFVAMISLGFALLLGVGFYQVEIAGANLSTTNVSVSH